MPDDVLLKVKDNGGVVMINFYNGFVNCSDTADLSQVADHIQVNHFHSKPLKAVLILLFPAFFCCQYIRDLIGADHVGIGADFDGVSFFS